MKTITFGSTKGGVAKTTSVAAVGAALARLGKKVLLVDFDSQGNLTTAFGQHDPPPSKTILNLISKECSVEEVVLNIDKNLDLIPEYNDSLSTKQAINIISDDAGEYCLQDALGAIKTNYDFCLIDSPGMLSDGLIACFTASEQVYIPLQAHVFSEDAMVKISDKIEKIKRYNPKLAMAGVFLTFYDEREKSNREVLQKAKARYNGLVCNTQIGYSDSLKNGHAVAYGVSIFDYQEKVLKRPLRACEDYKSLAKEIIKRSK